MTSSEMPTQFAPAERAPGEKIAAQARYLLKLPLFERLFNAVPDIVLVVNQQRQIVFANHNLLKTTDLNDDAVIIGLRPGEALGCVHAFETEGGCGTSEFCQTCGAVQALLSSLKGQESIQECRIALQNGDALDLQVWATPLTLDGETFSIFAVKDISHEKRRQALERIFLHDLLNVAGGLRGFAGLLTEATPAELETITGALSRLSGRLIEEINTQRELNAAESNELLVHPTRLDSQALLQEVLTLYQHHEAAGGRRLELDPHAPLVSFTSDLTLLQRVIGNMVKNALEAAAPGEVVTLGCTAYPDMIEFWVHNPGYMPRQVQLQIFQRSFSTKGTGRGLGTYSMKLLSERYLKGRVSFTSSPDHGTVFHASFPLTLDS
ncbi:MAG: sensor histidine kinase [Chloroflexota bacterium]|nr:MAG: sensor histidine kinase [Chloroflexota bacterium]